MGLDPIRSPRSRAAAGGARRQRGIAALLLVILTGLSLSAVTMGMMHYVRGAQDAQMTAHAQTQAEMKAWSGVQALAAFLNGKSESAISAISSVSLSPSNGISVSVPGGSPSPCTSGSHYYCFDVKGQSGGATSTVRTVFTGTTTLGSSGVVGSIFAGGLQVGGSATLKGVGDQVSIAVKNGTVTDNSGNTITLTDISVLNYVSQTFITPDDPKIKALANYVFNAGQSLCIKQNLKLVTNGTACTSSDAAFASYSSTTGWTLSGTLPAGVLWFDGNVTIGAVTNQLVVNTIIATGSITISNKNGQDGTLNTYYAPRFKPSPNPTCSGSNYPTQLCDGSGNFLDVGTTLGIGNILFLSGGDLDLYGQNGVATSYYGNIIASTLSGGTGAPSGKLTGTGTINVVGNLIASNPNQLTWMNGNITVTLANTTTTNAQIPTYVTTYALKYASYQ